jgi:hypothetical protein
MYGRLKIANYINKKAAVLMRGDKRFAAENKILRREIEDLQKAIFKKKRKRKRGKVLNFHKKNEIKNQILIFSSAKVIRARERAAALEKTEIQQKRTAANRKMQQTIVLEGRPQPIT